MSWPIIKTALRVFNNESVEEYYQRSYTIATEMQLAKSCLLQYPKPLFAFASNMPRIVFLEGQEGTSKKLKEYL